MSTLTITLLGRLPQRSSANIFLLACVVVLTLDLENVF